MSVRTKPFITPEEYLERERAAEFKSEYYNGEIFAMSGGSRNHVLIAGNCQMALRSALKDKGCLVFQSDLRVHIPSNDLYTYPDVVVVCGEEQYLDNQKDTLVNPVLVVEVLSPSTESYDRGQKFEFYRSIASLQEYVNEHRRLPARIDEMTGKVSSKYVDRIVLEHDGSIRVIFSDRARKLSGHSVSFVPENKDGRIVDWVCRSNDLPDQCLPSSCRRH